MLGSAWISTLLTLAVCRTPALLSSHSSVDRALAGVLVAMGSIPLGYSYFFCPTLESCWFIQLAHFISMFKNSPALLIYHRALCFPVFSNVQPQARNNPVLAL